MFLMIQFEPDRMNTQIVARILIKVVILPIANIFQFIMDLICIWYSLYICSWAGSHGNASPRFQPLPLLDSRKSGTYWIFFVILIVNLALFCYIWLYKRYFRPKNITAMLLIRAVCSHNLWCNTKVWLFLLIIELILEYIFYSWIKYPMRTICIQNRTILMPFG